MEMKRTWVSKRFQEPGQASFRSTCSTPRRTPPSWFPGVMQYAHGLTMATRTRYLYAPQLLVVTPSLQPPIIDGTSLALNGGTMHFDIHGFPGQSITVMASTDLLNWVSLETQTLTGTVWQFQDPNAGNFSRRFYKAALSP